MLIDCDGAPEAIIIATGSEVGIAAAATRELQNQGVAARLVSMPCCEAFDAQSEAYKESVLPAQCEKRLAVEAAHGDYWYKYVGLKGRVLSQNTFGESAPGAVLFEHFGFTTEAVIKQTQALLA